MSDWRTTILAMRSPIAQRYAFARYVLGEDPMAAMGIAATFQNTPMDEAEYDHIAAQWAPA